LGVNVGPILAGAGVVGLAAGFRAQHLGRDLVSGFFLILENQIRVGDSAIITLANATMDWSGYVIDVAVSYREDPDRVIEIMRQAAGTLRQEAAFGRLMLEPIEIFGVDNFTESAVIIKARLKTLPSQQHVVGREFRRRLKKAFDAAGVDLPPAARAGGAPPERPAPQSP